MMDHAQGTWEEVSGRKGAHKPPTGRLETGQTGGHCVPLGSGSFSHSPHSQNWLCEHFPTLGSTAQSAGSHHTVLPSES